MRFSVWEKFFAMQSNAHLARWQYHELKVATRWCVKTVGNTSVTAVIRQLRDMIISGFYIDLSIWGYSYALFVCSSICIYIFSVELISFVLIEEMVHVNCSRKKQFRTGRHRWILDRFWVRFKLNSLRHMVNYALIVVSLMQRWVKTGPWNKSDIHGFTWWLIRKSIVFSFCFFQK